ncbi:Hpt domain-containing protein [Duganella sp. FT50W]|uniref:Hpt domain-containing protein n=1 Tax=Duganella lactea TaxID=2692173 RepID=A0A6L8MFD1_9BURK|nr:Hpt domain-containing protein [Duganella lactea]MYM35036.1 Hpt domain-containing protein [Duganella lactea]MYM80911.1 Hpt domain-containing protein [Duganella lactea]
MSEESIFSVDTLVKYMGNDDKALGIVAKIVRDACAPGLEPFEQAGAALREGRLDDAGKIFHSVRGSIGALGAKRLVSASLKLEQAIAEQRGDAIPSLFAALESEYQLVLRDAQDWLQRNTPAAG